MNESASPPRGGPRLRVDILRQTLEVIDGDQPGKCYRISTSKFGTGFAEGSFQTPTGNFLICEKIGGGQPQGAVFRARQPTGEIHAGGGQEDAILTRILRLEGCDSANANTRDRYIYIHGTNREDLLGQPASHGCVRMHNADIIELFDRLPVGTSVEIC